MQRKLTIGLIGGGLVASMLSLRTVRATPSAGFTATTVAMGRVGNTDVLNHALPSTSSSEEPKPVWISLQKVRGLSDLYVQSNVWIPGGTTGWHTHPGHSLIIVTDGEVTTYEGHDSECTPHVYKKGEAFLDPGGDHVHNIRNEGATEARTMAVQLIPADATRRIDAERPAGCSF